MGQHTFPGRAGALGRCCHPSSPTTSASAPGCGIPPLPPALAQAAAAGAEGSNAAPVPMAFSSSFLPRKAENQQKGRFSGLCTEPEAGPGGAALSHPLLLPIGHPPAGALRPWQRPDPVRLCPTQGYHAPAMPQDPTSSPKRQWARYWHGAASPPSAGTFIPSQEERDWAGSGTPGREKGRWHHHTRSCGDVCRGQNKKPNLKSCRKVPSPPLPSQEIF